MFKWAYWILVVLFIAGCSSNHSNRGNSSQQKYAKCFELTRYGSATILTLKNPENGAIEKKYALVRNKGQKTPSDCERIQVPVRRIVALSATHIGMINALNARNAIVGTTDAKYLFDRQLLESVKQGTVRAFGDESSVPVSVVAAIKTDLIVYSGFGTAFPNESKLNLLGIHALADYDWKEADPLGRAEWIKVFGALLCKEAEAEKIFETVESNYKQVKSMLAGKYSVKVISGAMFNGVWYAPAGESYMARLFKDAGLRYIYAAKPGNGSCERSFSQVLRETKGVTLWLNPGVSKRTELLKQNSRYALLTPYKKGKIYCYTANANFFWEQSSLHPDWMLSDLAAMSGNLHPLRMYFYSELK